MIRAMGRADIPVMGYNFTSDGGFCSISMTASWRSRTEGPILGFDPDDHLMAGGWEARRWVPTIGSSR